MLNIPIYLKYPFLNWNDHYLANFINNVSYAFLAFFGTLSACSIHIYQKDMINLVKEINDKNKAMLQKATNEIRLQSNSIYKRLFWVWILAIVLTLLFTQVFIFEFIETGEAHYRNYFYHFTPFSLGAFFEYILNAIIIAWMGFLASGWLVMVCEILLRVTLFFKITVNEINQLRNEDKFDETDEVKVLRQLFSNYSLLRRFVYFESVQK